MNSVGRYDAGESAIFFTTLEKPDPSDLSSMVPIQSAEIQSLTLTLTDAQTGQVINGRENVNVLNENGGQVHPTSGGFRFDFDPEDTTRLSDEASVHVADFVCVHSGETLNFTHRLFLSHRLSLCTFEEVKLQRKDIAEEERLFIEAMIDAFTQEAELFTNRVFRKSTEASPTVQVFSPTPDQWSVKLDRWPVDKIVSVKESDAGDFENASALPETEYHVVAEGILRMKYRPFIGGVGSLQVIHAGGLYREVGAVPPDLRMKAMRQVAYWHQRKTALGVSGESISGHSASFYATQDLLDDVKSTLRRYRRKVPSL